MSVDPADDEALRARALSLRERSRHPFAAGMAIDDLIAAVRARAERRHDPRGAEALLAALVDERQDEAHRKYTAILTAEARRRFVALNLPAGRLGPEDLVGRALAEAVEKRGQFRGATEAEYISWLLTILQRQSLNELEYQLAKVRDPARELPQPGPDSTPPAARRADSQLSTPSERARTREFADAVAGVLATLDDADLTVFVRHYVDKATLAAIGAEASLHPKTVAERLGRVVRRLAALRGLAEGIRASRFTLAEVVDEARAIHEANRARAREEGASS